MSVLRHPRKLMVVAMAMKAQVFVTRLLKFFSKSAINSRNISVYNILYITFIYYVVSGEEASGVTKSLDANRCTHIYFYFGEIIAGVMAVHE